MGHCTAACSSLNIQKYNYHEDFDDDDDEDYDDDDDDDNYAEELPHSSQLGEYSIKFIFIMSRIVMMMMMTMMIIMILMLMMMTMSLNPVIYIS